MAAATAGGIIIGVIALFPVAPFDAFIGSEQLAAGYIANILYPPLSICQLYY